jgi:hypothetical protein
MTEREEPPQAPSQGVEKFDDWITICQRRVCSLYWKGLRDHNQHKNILDSNFRPNYGRFMKQDRLQNKPSIIC